MKNFKLLSIILLVLLTHNVKAQLSPAPPFLEYSEPISARISDYSNKDTIDSNSGLVRLPNGKIAYMTKEDGKMQPFFIKGIETGYWDTRYEPDTDYNSVFADMRDMGANTAYVMLHWEDIETSDNNFDFSFPDLLETIAQQQNIKLKWVLFLHAQFNGVPSHHPETAWTFHIDDRDSVNYAMQWPKQNGKVYKTIKDVVSKGGVRPLHLYGHPEVFYRIRRMLYNLAVHYRDSETVIGVQLGNEEGFSFLDESDFNPITADLYEEWKLKTNKTDYSQFKREAINWWWKQFTSAYHEGDPYKILSFNLDAGQAEAGDRERIDMTGTSAATYADGNLDAIGTMFYKGWGYKAFDGLDERYNEGSYNYQLPILIPSEIGIGNFNSPRHYRNFVMHSLERGAQGFGVYCYGEVRKELPDTLNARKDMVDLFNNIKQTEDLVFAGLPGPGFVKCTTLNDAAKVSHLNVDGKETLVMVYFPEIDDDADIVASNQFDLLLNFKANKKGTYTFEIYKNGKLLQCENMDVDLNKENEIIIQNVSIEDVLFISIR